MSCTAGDDSVAQYVKPYFNRRWDGLHGYFYTPPKEETGGSAAAVSRSGSVAHISFRVFQAYYSDAMYAHKALVRLLLERFLPRPLLRAGELPSTARATVTKGSDFRLLHVKVTYPEPRGAFDIVEEHNTLSAGKKVSVRGKCAEVLRLPDKTPVPFEYQDGYTVLQLPEITGYDMFLLKN